MIFIFVISIKDNMLELDCTFQCIFIKKIYIIITMYAILLFNEIY